MAARTGTDNKKTSSFKKSVNGTGNTASTAPIWPVGDGLNEIMVPNTDVRLNTSVGALVLFTKEAKGTQSITINMHRIYISSSIQYDDDNMILIGLQNMNQRKKNVVKKIRLFPW